VPRHDQTRNQARQRTWFGRIPTAWTFLAAALVSGSVAGQDSSAPIALPGSFARTREPVELAARRVSYWSIGPDQFVLLDGDAAIQQSTEIVRASQAVARVRTVSTDSGPSYTVDVYTETPPALSTGSPGQSPLRFSWVSTEAPRINPYTKSGLSRLDGPPPQLALWVRAGFGSPRPRRESESTARQPESRSATSRPITRALPLVPVPDTSSPRAQTYGGLTTQTPRPGDTTPTVMQTVYDSASVPERIESGTPLAPSEDATPPEAVDAVSPRTPRDRAVRRAQFGGPMGFDEADDPAAGGPQALPPPIEISPLDSAPTVPALTSPDGDDDDDAPTRLAPIPAPGSETETAPATPRDPKKPRNPYLPFVPGSQRVTRIFPRNGTSMVMEQMKRANGLDTTVVRGGVNIVLESPQLGVVDIVADSAVIWRRVDEKGRSYMLGPTGEQIDDPNQPLEVYLEGNVVIRQDEHKVAGNGDQKTVFAKRAFYDLRSERLIATDAEVNMFAPGLVAPMRVISPRIDQYQPLERQPDGTYTFGLSQIRADRTMSTGSRFANPGYRFNSRSVDLFRIVDTDADPNTGKTVGPNGVPKQDLTWRIDARQNVFYMGWVPVFYWPRFVSDADDLEPPLRQFAFRTNNYFGQQLLLDFNGFKLFGIKKPKNIDLWNLDVDYLSARTKTFPALGSEIGWFGSDLINDISDPYHQVKNAPPSAFHSYFGYLDLWGLRDYGNDILGAGPAIITNNLKAGKAGFQRGGGGRLGSVPPFQDFRGRVSFRHMQRLVPEDEEVYDDFRFQLEVGFTSDRYFLEEYYKRLFDVGMDQETLAYAIKQKDNTAWTLWTEANLQSWQTETQWLPKGDYYRLGDSILGNRLTYFQHTGVDYANVHTASEVNNPNIFAFMPYDPISNTSGSWSSGRGYTSHELDMPMNFFDNIFRVVPYVQGQATGWTNQIDGQGLGRVWGAAGIRAEIMAWKVYPSIQSELFNVHGINHKISLEADFRSAYSNVNLNRIGVQDDLDDNTYESTRRYFALTNYAGGLLPTMYDPRLLILRRALSPITGTNDIQGSMETLHMGIHQRLQTKRGPEGRRRIIDYMSLDLDTTFFPYASRDNFNKPFGQNTYNWQWFLGDRASILSYGWFEFWNIGGNPIYNTNISRANNPFGLNVITSGISLNRPPRGNVFMGYSVINTGPINTSALNLSTNYWMSPKWYGTYSTMYDFGNGILLAGVLSLTRIGPDYITSVGLTLDPQRQSYQFAFQVTPRLSPNMRLGSGVSSSNFDPRYAPTQ
jgi:hypothetical protein